MIDIKKEKNGKRSSHSSKMFRRFFSTQLPRLETVVVRDIVKEELQPLQQAVDNMKQDWLNLYTKELLRLEVQIKQQQHTMKKWDQKIKKLTKQKKA